MSYIETRNAVIESTMLGYEGHGIFSAYLQLDYGCAGQSFGGYAMDEPKGERGAGRHRVGTAFGMDFIIAVMKVVGVESWEELKGKHVRVKSDFGKVYALGNFLKDEWFTPEDLAQKHKQPTPPAVSGERGDK